MNNARAKDSTEAAVADTIYTNGEVITVNDAQPSAEAVAVKDGKILAVGARDDVMRYQGPSTEVVDLKGRTMVPGFVDGHSHICDYGPLRGYPTLSLPPVDDVKSIDDIIISPLRSALKRGMKFANHTDAPVTPPDQMMVIHSAVNGASRSGVIVGPEGRISPMDALKAVTIWGAYLYFEENEKGSIEPGKRADLVVLSANPLTVDDATIKDIKVLQTIKDGKKIYDAASKTRALVAERAARSASLNKLSLA
jgi:predicted amidohydrolase YtcJ